MRFLLVGSCIACITAAFIAGTSFGASRAKANVTNLLHTSLEEEFTPDREVLIDLVEIPPETSLDRHWHPGEEFHYYLEGTPEVQIGEGPVQRPAIGTVGHVPFKAAHRAGAGESGAKILVVRIHSKGKPWRYLEGGTEEGTDAERR